jgi:hypothetical protein
MKKSELKSIIREEIIKEIKVTQPGGLNYDDLIKLLINIYREDPENFEDWFETEQELYDAYKGQYIVSELIAYDKDTVLEDYYRQYNKILVDNKDYTDYFWDSLNMYKYSNKSLTDFLRMIYPDIKQPNVYFIRDVEDWDTLFEYWNKYSNLSLHTKSDILELCEKANVPQSDINYIMDLPEVSNLERG